jgi:zinc protease
MHHHHNRFSTMRPLSFGRFLLSVASALLLSLPGLSTAQIVKSIQAAHMAMEAQAGGFTSYKLANGFKILLVPYPNATDVRIELLIKSGSKVEAYGQTGTAHLLEHMLFKRAGKRLDVGADLRALTVSFNATTSKDATRYHAALLPEPERIAQVLRIKADQFFRPLFDPGELALEISVVLNELENLDQEPSSVMFAGLARNSFASHGYARPVIGARSDIRRATAHSLRSFHRTHYRPDNATIIVSGRFEQRQVLSLVQQLFSKARNPKSATHRSHTTEEDRAMTQRSDIFLPTHTGIEVASAWRLPGYAHPDMHAADLAITAVCDQDWGSIRHALVYDQKVAQSASCFVHSHADYSMLLAFAETKEAGDAQALLQALTEHVQAAAAKGVSQQQTDRARITNSNYFEKLSQTHADMVSMLVEAETAGDWRLAFWARDTAQSMTAANANTVLGKWIVATNRADIVLQQAATEPVPEIPQRTDLSEKLQGKTWPSFVIHGQRPPESLDELARATQVIQLDAHGARAALITRRTQNDKVWMEFKNDYGNAATLAAKSQACNVTDALMAHGGGGLSRDELSAKLEPLNARYVVSLDGFGLEIPRNNLGSAFAALFAAWNRPLLPATEFASIKARFISFYEKQMDKPEYRADFTLRQRFDNYPAGHPDKPKSAEELLRATRELTLADVQACAEDFASVSHVRLGVLGAVTEQELKSMWSDLKDPRRSSEPYQMVDLPPAPQRLNTDPIVETVSGQTHADIKGVALLAMSSKDPDDPALQLATDVLSQRAWRLLRTDKGLSYSAGAHLEGRWLSERTQLVVTATSSVADSNLAESALKNVLADALQQGFTEFEIEDAKRTWAEARRSSLDVVDEQVAQALAESLLNGADYGLLSRYDQAISRLSAAKVNAVWRKRMADTPVVWMTVKGDQ